jgi:hypothetical protein
MDMRFLVLIQYNQQCAQASYPNWLRVGSLAAYGSAVGKSVLLSGSGGLGGSRFCSSRALSKLLLMVHISHLHDQVWHMPFPCTI